MDGMTFQEHWQQADSEQFKGHGLLISGSDTVFQESLFLLKTDDYVSYITTGGNDHPTLFTLTTLSDSSWTFENPEHDFPQRLTYHFVNDNTLEIKVTGEGWLGFENTELFTVHRSEQ